MNTAHSSDPAGIRERCGMRVALVTETFPPEVNGVAMTIGRMVDGLLARGHYVQLIRPRQSATDAPRVTSHLEEVLTRGMPIPVYQGLRFGFISRRRLLRLWMKERPELVHVVTEGPLGWAAIRVARQLRLPISSGFHTNFHSYAEHYGAAYLQRPVAAYLRHLHQRTHATLVPTRALADDLAADGYDNLVVVSRGVDTALFDAARRSRALRASWGVGDDGLVLLYAGRLAQEKNVRLVLDAYAAIRRVLPRARLVFVGDGPLRSELKAACPSAVFAGVLRGADLGAHYASADMFVFPSLTETFGNVTTEAMASGLAVLAYDHAAAGELIDNGQNGRIVPAGDAAGFIQAAQELASDTPLREKLGAAASETALGLDWDAVHDHLSHTLHGIVHRHRQLNSGRDATTPARPG
jgi:glycosyltransferase involved in cell wall biosynthesis